MKWSAYLLFALPAAILGESSPGLQLNQVLYRPGDAVEVAVEPGPRAGRKPAGEARLSTEVLLVGEKQHDIELLRREGSGAKRAARGGRPVRVENAPATVNDGRLQLLPGERFFALLFSRRGKAPATAAFAMGASWTAKGFPIRIDEALTRVTGVRGGGRSGVLAGREGIVEIATDHLIYHPRSEGELGRFLAQTHGEMIRTLRSANGGRTVAVRFNPDRYVDGAALLRSLSGDTNELSASSQQTAAMYASVLAFQLQGYRVAPDPVLLWQGSDFGTADGIPGGPLEMNYLSGSTAPLSLLPGMRQAWTYAWLFELDRKRIKIAFADQGIAPNPDFRGMTTNSIWQCDLADHQLSDPSACAFGGWNGVAAAPQTVGNSLFGGLVWHGNGVVTAATGLLNNGYGGAGVAGQIGVPMLYRMDLHAYALEFSDAIRKATDDGAQVINISAGYPCRLLVRTTPYEICNWEGRARLVHDLNLAAVSAAFAACGPFAPACLSGAISQISDFTSLIVEAGGTDLRDVLSDAVAYANAHGTVVVAGAGNRSHSDFFCRIVDCDNVDSDEWQVIPCIVSGVICVGAVGGTSATGYSNEQFKGTSVALWAPAGHAYWAPPDPKTLTPPDTQGAFRTDDDGNPVAFAITATSGATPVVSGSVALIEAGREDLDRGNPALTPADIAMIPGKVRDLLVGSSVTTTATNDPSLTLHVVNPYAAMRAAFSGVMPDAELVGGARWFLDFIPPVQDPAARMCGGADDASDGFNTTFLSAQQTCLGSILTIDPTGSPGGLHRVDTDLTYWRVPPGDRFATTFTVSSPSRTAFGYVGIDGLPGTPAGVSPIGGVEAFEYPVLPHFGSQSVPIMIGGLQGSDNAYALSVGAVQALPALQPDRFDKPDTHPLHLPDNDTRDKAAPVGATGAIPAEDGWDLTLPDSPSIVLGGLNFHRPGDTDWVRIDNVPASAWTDCGSVLTASAPDDVHVQLVRTLAGTGLPRREMSREGQLYASLHIEPGSEKFGRFYARFNSKSDAAIEYEARIALVHLSPIVCRLKAILGDATLFSPLPPYIVRWPLAAEPDPERSIGTRAALFFDHPGGALKLSGRLLQGQSLTAELLNSEGRRVWRQKVGTRELEKTTRGGQTFALDVRARRGTYFLVLAGRSPAEVEISPPALERTRRKINADIPTLSRP